MNLLTSARRPVFGPSSGDRPRRGPAGRGVTLIELMVALAITMIMMTAVVTLFANLSSTVSTSRALIEISERLRAARNRLQLDLAGHTANTLPPLRPEDGEGYLEIVEGPNNDAGSVLVTITSGATTANNYQPVWSLTNPTSALSVPNPLNGQLMSYPGIAGADANGNTVYPSSIMGDADDVLALTVRSSGEPFVGWGWNSTTNTRMLVESPTAEVIWYAVPNGRSLPAGAVTGNPNPYPVQLYTLYRRVLLVSPQAVPAGPVAAANTASAIQFGGPSGTINTNPATIPLFYNNFDISVRSAPDSTGTYNIAVGNSLTDLTNRQNRFLHGFQLTPSAAGNYLVNKWTAASNWPTTVMPPAATTPPTPANFGSLSFPYELQSTTPMVQNGNASLASNLWSLPAALTNGAYTNSSNNTIQTLPFPNDKSVFNPVLNTTMAINSRLGEDVILTDVLAFDVRVFDPMAPLVATANGEVLVPSDPGYTTQVNLINAGNATGSIAGFGAFVDMGYNGVVPYPTSLVSVTAPPNVTPTPAPLLASQFCNYPNAVSTLLSAPTMSNPYTVSQATYFNANAQLMPQTYDTFSLGVEQNNFDEDEGNVAAGAPGVGMVDQGSDGLDDDQTATAGTSKPDGIVDNVPQVSAPYLVSSGTAKPSVVEGYASSGERETMAPYPFPLRGVQVILRVYEPDTRQVRQVTIVQDFLPD